MEEDIKYITSNKNCYQFFLSNISFGREKETSQGDFSFTQPKRMLLYRH